MPVFLNAQSPCNDVEKSFDFPDSVQQYVDDIETTVSNGVQNLVQFFENIIFGSPQVKPTSKVDVTLVGFVNFADGIGRHPILFKKCLKDSVTMNFLSTRNIPAYIEDQQLGLPRLDPNNKEDVGAVAILTDILSDKALNIYRKMPESKIKIAYTMFEATEIPNTWVPVLNNNFDMAVVPDQFLVDVYKRCGVRIPIFVLPLPLMLEGFLESKPRIIPHKPFVFGFSGGFWARKNHIRILEAFAQEFGNRNDVKLRLHGRFGEESIIQELSKTIAEKNLTNVELIVEPFSWPQYLDFFKSLDCCVCLSMGEGFSITPRESLAAGIPCIVSNNTGQTTICNSGAVYAVESNVPVPAFYDCHYDNGYGFHSGLKDIKKIFDFEKLEQDLITRSGFVGYQFDCSNYDARKAMREVYQNYYCYLGKALLGRQWVRQYLVDNLHKKYLNLVKPQSLIFGDKDVLGDKFLMTTSKELFEKYKEILGLKK